MNQNLGIYIPSSIVHRRENPKGTKGWPGAKISSCPSQTVN
jgi:hypothetical protein